MSIPTVRSSAPWPSLFEEGRRMHLEAILPAWLRSRRWFAGKARAQRGVTIVDAVPVAGHAYVTLIRVEYSEGEPDIYALPMAFAAGAESARIESESPGLVLARIEGSSPGMDGILYDASASSAFATALLDAMVHGRSFAGDGSRIECSPAPAMDGLISRADAPLTPYPSTAEQSNTSIRFGDLLLLKLFRRLPAGTNPDLEIGRMLAASRFSNSPPLAGAIEYHASDGEERTLGVLHGFVAGAIDGWEFTLDELARFHQRARSLVDLASFPEPATDGAPQTPGDTAALLLGPYLESARLLGRRTAGMHLALYEDRGNPAFAPERFTPDSWREMRETMRDDTRRNLHLLRDGIGRLAGEPRDLAASVLAAEPAILARFGNLGEVPFTGLRIRIHGDYHLGQTLCKGGDFFIVDFEGEPSAPLRERRIKRTPFHDLAGMLRSFDYAANAALRREFEKGAIAIGMLPHFTTATVRWTKWISAAFLESYLRQPGIADILPPSTAERALLLETHLLRKALYELAYELNNRPDWLPIPCRGLLTLVGATAGRTTSA